MSIGAVAKRRPRFLRPYPHPFPILEFCTFKSWLRFRNNVTLHTSLLSLPTPACGTRSKFARPPCVSPV